MSAAADNIRRTLDLTSVRVEVTWVASERDMAAARKAYGVDIERGTRLHGFSVLGIRDGEHVCLLFVPRPWRVDDAPTVTIGHELLHCLLGSYH